MKRNIIVVFLLISFFCAILFCLFCCFRASKKYDSIVEKYALNYKLDEALIFAVIKAESGFDEKAVSRSGAIGLMQLMPSTAKWIADEIGKVDFSDNDLFDAETNIEFGCFYLNYLFKRFNDMKVVICAYNAGETVVGDWLDDNGRLNEENILYKETAVYLSKVLKYFEYYKNL